MEKQVLSQDELGRLNQIRVEFDNLATVMGSLETQITLLNLEKEEVVTRIKELKTTEIKLGNELKERYGDGNISLETGEFTPIRNNEPSFSLDSVLISELS